MLSAPLVIFIPAHSPSNKLKQPLLPSKSSPAQVPASKFLSASGENPAALKSGKFKVPPVAQIVSD